MAEQPKWRVGGKVPLNVYEGDRPMFQCHTPEDAARVVAALNVTSELYEALKDAVAYVRFSKHEHHTDIAGNETNRVDVIHHMLAALAKARGEA